jgi:hypothetical protein
VEKHKEEIAELEEREKLVEKEKPVSNLNTQCFASGCITCKTVWKDRRRIELIKCLSIKYCY